MYRYENVANITISIDLHNGYDVIAMAQWDKENLQYKISLYLKNKKYNINHFDLIEEDEDIIIMSDIKGIKPAITRHVVHLYENGKLDKYFDRYEYEQKCFEYGNDYYESLEN